MQGFCYLTPVVRVILILTIVNVKILCGLQTQNCDHYQFEDQLNKTLVCEMQITQKEIDLVRSPIDVMAACRKFGCDCIDKINSCIISNIGTCFSEDQRSDIRSEFEKLSMALGV